MSTDERGARAALGRLTEPGDPRVGSLVSRMGAVALYEHLRNHRDLAGMASEIASRLETIDPEVELDQGQRLGLRFLIPGDDEWPRQVDDLAHSGSWQGMGGPPLGLWVRGPMRLDELTGSLSVVGSRSATSYGGEVAREIAYTVASAGTAIVSGAAFGIDYEAHRGALSAQPKGKTVAVLACGADRVYPTAHQRLFELLASEHAIVSEVPPGGAPLRSRFLTRNRLIAALSRATVVVEAATRSGALNTASWAETLSRPVLGVPGPVTSQTSGGVNQLLRNGATVVTQGADVLEVLGESGQHLVDDPREPPRPRDRLRRDEARVLEAVPVTRGAREDAISRAAGVGLLQVSGCLERLLQRGMVVRREEGWVLAGDALR